MGRLDVYRVVALATTPAPVAQVAAAEPVAPGQPAAVPLERGPGEKVYLLALMALGLIWGAVELLVFSRRCRR